MDTKLLKQYNANMRQSARITTDLGDPKWIKLLKLEASEKDMKIQNVIVAALELYFEDRLESKALAKAAESVFEEWDNPLDKDYDKL